MASKHRKRCSTSWSKKYTKLHPLIDLEQFVVLMVCTRMLKEKSLRFLSVFMAAQIELGSTPVWYRSLVLLIEKNVNAKNPQINKILLFF